MGSTPVLVIYCLLILLASLAGGWLPMLVRLTHRRLELAISFVSGVMAGIALLHLFPHALMERSAALAAAGERATLDHHMIEPVTSWLLVGFLAMFLLERFFCFHHHDAPGETASGEESTKACGHDHASGSDRHRLTWTGAAVGLTIHSVIAGAALGASVASTSEMPLPGLATFLVIFLHKPFDSMTLGTIMAVTDRPMALRQIVNGLFSLAIPLGVVLLTLGMTSLGADRHAVLSAALALSAGMFLCIALSDLLPELQFHRHDRVKLTLALLAGLALAWGLGRLEAAQHEDQDHDHDHALQVRAVAAPPGDLDRPGPRAILLTL